MKKIVLSVLSVTILCLACAAPAAAEEPPAFTSVREVTDRTEGDLAIVTHEDCMVIMLETGGRYYRMAVLPDDRARDLNRTATGDDYSVSAMEAFNNYAWTLPVSYTEELTEQPMTQAELDGFIGKTVRELMDNGFDSEMIIDKDELESPVRIYLDRGFFRYEFETDNAETGYPDLMTVRNGKLSGFSRAAFDFDVPE